jgi:hypothetical protein
MAAFVLKDKTLSIRGNVWESNCEWINVLVRLTTTALVGGSLNFSELPERFQKGDIMKNNIPLNASFKVSSLKIDADAGLFEVTVIFY